MKSLKYLIILFVALALLYFIYSYKFQVKSSKKSINTGSMQISSQLHDSQKEPQNKDKKAQEIEPSFTDDNVADIPEIEKGETELDYITAYRDWKYFETCFTDVEDFHNNKDPLDTLRERFANNPRESQTEPTAQQNSFYQYHVEVCKGMIVDEKDDYYANISRLEQRFNKITPKTEAAKQLQQALEITKELQAYKMQYTQAFYQKSSLSVEELAEINRQIEQLSEAMLSIYESAEVLSPEQNEAIQEYNVQIDNLRTEIIKSKVPDTELIKQLQATIDGHINAMDDYLHRVQSPDAFLVIAQTIYYNEFWQKNSSIISTMKNKTGILDSHYINILNGLVMPLVACSMNYPCDAQSDYILSYCLGLRDSMFNQACGKSLEDFYFNFYIGANQLNDVNNYFNFLVNKYAQ
ncbi:MAG: hypothetical protein L3J53_00855 [Proteobacteria bacterium]|nr:hypothetical protein [Pseudomonadota bacterium]